MLEKLRWKKIGIFLVHVIFLFCIACTTATERYKLFDSQDITNASEYKTEDKEDETVSGEVQAKGKTDKKVMVEEKELKMIGEIVPSKTTAPSTSLLGGIAGRLDETKQTSQKEGISVTEKGIVLNYDQAPITEVIDMIGKYLNINYTIDPSVKGTVNLQTYRGISKEDLWPVLAKVLRINNLGVTESDGIYEIHPLKDSLMYDISAKTGMAVGTGMDDMPVIQLIPLRHIIASDVSKMLANFITPTGKIIEYAPDNMLIIIDQRWNVRRLIDFIELFDVSQFSNLTLRMYEIQHVPVADLTKELESVLSQYGVDGKSTPTLGIRLIALDRLNALFVVSGNSELLQKTESLIRMMDIAPTEDAKTQIYIYPVAHADADDLAGLLGNILAVEEKEEKDIKRGKQVNIATEELASKTAKGERLASPVKKEATVEEKGTGENTAIGQLKKEVKIVADKKRNYLLINAIPQDYLTIQKLLRELDVVPRQALIEVIIADITLTDELKLGLEWQSTGGLGSGSTLGTVTAGAGAGLATGISSSGLSYAIAKTGELSATLRAMASEGRVNVLSAPTILTSDNEEASIDISSEVPYLTSTSTTTTESASTTSSSSIQYRDTGIILKVKPQISGKGLLKMEISQEVSEESGSGVKDSPIFAKRAAQTIVHVYDNQTIAIGGLMKHSKSLTNTGVPFLNRLPFIGWLFGYYGETVQKDELIILITARVIDSLEDIDIASDRFKKRVKLMKQELLGYKFEEIKPKLKQGK